MSKRLSVILSLLLGPWIIVGCGNKGELFLPPEQLIVQELEAVTQDTNGSGTVPADDEDGTGKQKRQSEQRPDQPSQ